MEVTKVFWHKRNIENERASDANEISKMHWIQWDKETCILYQKLSARRGNTHGCMTSNLAENGLFPRAYVTDAVLNPYFCPKGPINGHKDLRTCMGSSPRVPQWNYKQIGGLKFLAKIVKKAWCIHQGFLRFWPKNEIAPNRVEDLWKGLGNRYPLPKPLYRLLGRAIRTEHKDILQVRLVHRFNVGL